MDSVNPFESQSSPLNFRSTASNTTSFRCPCGGFNEFAQALPQAYCFLPPNLGQSQCKHSQDAEDKFPVQQHFYPSFPFVSPFFYNSPLANLYCPHNPAPETLAKEQQKQPQAQELENVFHQNGKRGSGTSEEDAPRNNNVLGLETQCFGHPLCFPNANGPPPPGSGLQRCGCGDSVPWTCSSFIVPMITYCVIWNPRNVATPSGNSPETCQLTNATGSVPDTSTDLPPASLTDDFNNTTQTGDECLVVDGVTNMEWRNPMGAVDIDQVTNRSFKSLASSIDKESGYGNTEENSDKNEINLEAGSDESEEDEDEDDEGEEDGETDEWVEEDKNDTEDTTNVYFSNESQSFMKPFDSQPPSTPGSYTDLKQLDKSKGTADGVSCTDMKANQPDSTAEEKIDPQKTHIRQEMCIKKFINNFTMTDQTNSVLEEGQSSEAAAGDLGGVNCVGYRLDVSNCFDDPEFEILKETQKVKSPKPKEIYAKALPHPEEGNNSPKISDKTTKNVRHFRSGIAKLLTGPKLKDSKTDPAKTTKTETRERVHRQLAVGKRKHNCYPSETPAASIDYSKTQKVKNYRLTPGGQEKHTQQQQQQQQQEKTKIGSSETPRREEKNSKAKIIKDAVKK